MKKRNKKKDITKHRNKITGRNRDVINKERAKQKRYRKKNKTEKTMTPEIKAKKNLKYFSAKLSKAKISLKKIIEAFKSVGGRNARQKLRSIQLATPKKGN